MKSYFGSSGEFTEKSLNLLNEINNFLENIYQRELQKGYNFRELTGIVVGAAFDNECKLGLGLGGLSTNAPTKTD